MPGQILLKLLKIKTNEQQQQNKKQSKYSEL
jgi:hypothetical protein